MPNVVSNATPLIYLAKSGQLNLLKELFQQVFIPEEVRIEVIDRGKALKEKDASVIEQAVEEGWLKVSVADPIQIPIKLHKGEEATLALAKHLEAALVLIDEAPAREAAHLLGLRSGGTLYVLLLALKKRVIKIDDFLEILEALIEQGFRLKEEVYIEAIREARKIATQTLEK